MSTCNLKRVNLKETVEMDVVTTSLEALIQRVTNPQNQNPDIAATEAFCVMLIKESEGIQIGTKLLALRIQSSNETEALQALALLDTCMRRCGSSFHAEVGKFRFLNEMIRLVSPKYLGDKTPAMVRQKVLQLLHTWTREYPKELKIKEAYEMLRKQGIEDNSMSLNNTQDEGLKTLKAKSTIFDDEEKSKLLQKLLRSKNPDDLQAANRLIKTMVREDERRVQLNSRRIMELESVHNNAKLLSEMLDSYNCNETSTEDLELMKELYQACERLKPTVLRLANETYQDNEGMLGDVLAASDELEQVFEKYTAVTVHGKCVKPKADSKPKTDSDNSPYLLDLSSPTENISLESDGVNASYNAMTTNHQSDMEVLGDIFNSLGKSEKSKISSVSDANLLMTDSVMQPLNVLPKNKKDELINTSEKKIDSKAKALEELNELGETLLKQSLSGIVPNSSLKSGSKKSINRPPNIKPLAECYVSTTFPRSGSSSHFSNLLETNVKNDKVSDICFKSNDNVPSHDDTNSQNNIECNMNENANRSSAWDAISVAPSTENSVIPELEIKPLTDINISLQDIKPGINPPMTVIEEKNGISVVLHFARDNPREDVFVVVITTMSKNSKPLTDYLFQAVVPKKCKCRLQPPSGTGLPAHNPFLPPSAITQIMLIANPTKEPVSLKFMLSYTMDDETFTEMGEVEKLPLI